MLWEGYDGLDYEIFLYDGSTIKQLTDNEYDDCHSQINNNNYVVWDGITNRVLLDPMNDPLPPPLNSEIFLYDGSNIIQLTTDSDSYNCNIMINNKGDVLWCGGGGFRVVEEYDLISYWFSELNVYYKGENIRIYDSGSNEINCASINEDGHVVFSVSDSTAGGGGDDDGGESDGSGGGGAGGCFISNLF